MNRYNLPSGGKTDFISTTQTKHHLLLLQSSFIKDSIYMNLCDLFTAFGTMAENSGFHLDADATGRN